MSITRNFYELVRETYGPFFPTSKDKREAFLDKVRQKVDYYKPKIEDRCNVNLGEVKVKDNRVWLSEVLSESAFRGAVENAWKQGRVPTKADFRFSYILASSVEAIATIPIWLYNSFAGADFRHNNSTIYVPFYYMNRFGDIDFEKRKQRLDYGVVHELSHTLWEKIAGDNTGFGIGRKWFEGFATYCADDYFLDFYPGGVEKMSDLKKVYTDGKKEIERLVQRHGKGIVLEVPKRWQEF